MSVGQLRQLWSWAVAWEASHAGRVDTEEGECLPRSSKTGQAEGSSGDLSLYRGEAGSERAWRERGGELRVYRGTGRDMMLEPLGTEHLQKGQVGSELVEGNSGNLRALVVENRDVSGDRGEKPALNRH